MCAMRTIRSQQAPCTLAAMSSSHMLALAVLTLSAGCAHLPACPSEGGSRWSEWSSPHFRVLTDVEDDEDAETLAAQLEHFRAAIVAAAWRDVHCTRCKPDFWTLLQKPLRVWKSRRAERRPIVRKTGQLAEGHISRHA